MRTSSLDTGVPMRRYKALLAAILLTLTTTTVVTAFATPAHASGPCYWYSWGDSSNCDGVGSWYCEDIQPNDTEWADVQYSFSTENYELFLLYSPRCEAVWASGFTSPKLPKGSLCYITLVRNSDGESITTRLVNTSWNTAEGDTAMLYDAGVTSYAYMYCRRGTGGPTWSGWTIDW